MSDSSNRKVISYVADLSDIKAKLKQLEMMNKRLGGKIGKDLGQGIKTVGQNLGQISTTKATAGFNELNNTSSKTSQIFKNIDGSLVQMTKTTKINDKGIKKTTTSFKDLNTNSVSLGENISRLAKRAVLTIPLWLAFRGAIMGTYRTITDGLKTIAKQDEALQKSKRNIQGTVSSITANYATLRSEALRMSLETGESVETIVNSFQKFATVGFDFETSMQGANGAVKLATLLFGSATENANAFARSMRVLVDKSDSVKSAGQQITEAMAITAELWKTNAFEISEFTQDLEKFAGTAKTTNITTKETLALLATLSTAGLRKRGGRLLRTSISKLLENLDKLAGTLGVRVNPELDTTFTVLIKVISELEKLQATTGSLGPTTEIISDIFGGVRGAEVVRALIALRTELNKNMEVTGDIAKFNKEFEEQNKQINRLAKQYSNLNKEIGKGLVTGAVGGDDFRGSLERYVQFLKVIQKLSVTTGTALSKSFNAFNAFALFGDIKSNKAFKELKKAVEASAEAGSEAGRAFSEKYSKALDGQLNTNKISDLLIEATTFGADALKMDAGDFDEVITKLKEILEIRKKIDVVDEKEKISNKINLKDKQEVAKLVLQNALNEAKALGASESQLLKLTDITSKKLGIEEQTIDKLSRQMELEKAIANEKRLQSELGSDSLKLFQIAKTKGTEQSKTIGDVLSGDIDFASFIKRGGDVVDTFKKEFANIYEQQQAKQFYRGERVSGEAGLRGGTGVNIQEEFIRKSPRSYASGLPLAQRRAETQFGRIEKASYVTPVTFNVNVDATNTKEVSKKVIEEVSSQLPKLGTQINKALTNLLLGKQS